MSDQHTVYRVALNDEVQAVCQRYAHGNGSSTAIVAAVLRAAGHGDLLEALRRIAHMAETGEPGIRAVALAAVANATGVAA